jgi:hypothetical protein
MVVAGAEPGAVTLRKGHRLLYHQNHAFRLLKATFPCSVSPAGRTQSDIADSGEFAQVARLIDNAGIV